MSNKCPKCGFENEEDTCMNCGISLKSEDNREHSKENTKKTGNKLPIIISIMILIGIIGTIIFLFLSGKDLPIISDIFRNKETDLKICEKYLTNMAKACELYASHNNGHYPARLEEVVERGFMRKLPECPVCKKPYTYFSQTNPDFFIIKCGEKNSHIDTGLVQDGDYPVYNSKEGLILKGNYISSLNTGEIINPTENTNLTPVEKPVTVLPTPVKTEPGETPIKKKTQKEKQINPEAVTHNEKGLKYTDENNYDMALKEFDLAIEIAPDYVEAIKNKGNVYYYKGDMTKALECYELTITRDPEYWNGYNNIGNIYYEQKDIENALKYYTKAAEICTDDIKPYNNLGDILIEEGKYEEAIENYNRALKLGLENNELYSQMGFSYWRIAQTYLEQKQTDKAWEYANKSLQSLGKATELNPKDPVPYFRAGQIYFNFGPDHFDEAVKCMTQAIEKAPDNATYLYARALVYDGKGDKIKAQKDFDMAMKIAQDGNDQDMIKKIKDASLKLNSK